MLSANLVPEESRQDYLDTLNTESQRLTSLVEGVLEYARVENRMVRLNRSSLKGDELAGRLTEAIREGCESAGVSLRTENSLPPARILHTDPDLVQRIAGVLVSNACRYARRGDDGQVLLRLGGNDGQFELDVIGQRSRDRCAGFTLDFQALPARAVYRDLGRGRHRARAGVGAELGGLARW